MMSARLTFDTPPLHPESLAARIERGRILSGRRLKAAREWLDGGRAELRRLREREMQYRRHRREQAAARCDRPRWKAIRKDVARGVPMADVLSLYGVTEAQYWRALAAGATGADAPEVRS